MKEDCIGKGMIGNGWIVRPWENKEIRLILLRFPKI